MFQQKIAYGKQGCPFKCSHAFRDVSYNHGISPVCEKMHFDELINHELMRPFMSGEDLDDVFAAFAKKYGKTAASCVDDARLRGLFAGRWLRGNVTSCG